MTICLFIIIDKFIIQFSYIFPLLFVKFCKEKYNVTKNCTTLQFGTLKYYQKIENDPRSDTSEGKIKITTQDEQKITVTPGSADFPWMTMEPGSKTTLDNITLINLIHYNVHIFCMSEFSDGTPIQQYEKNFECDSHWTVDYVKMNVFIDYLLSIYRNSFTFDSLDIRSQKILKSNLVGFRVGCMFGNINYVSNKDIKKNEYGRSNFEEILRGLVFTKNEKYKDELEFRIAFLPMCGNELLHVREEPKCVNLIPGLKQNVG